MIVENHQIAFRNVASKFYNFLPEEIDLAIKDFDTILSDYGYQADGKIFFSIISDPTAEVMTAELFLRVEESYFDIPKQEEIDFRSYFLVNHMIMTRIIADFELQSQVKYWELIEYIKEHKMTQKTPIFVELITNQAGQSYAEMSVGVLD